MRKAVLFTLIMMLMAYPVMAFEMGVKLKAGGHIYENEYMDENVPGAHDMDFSSPMESILSFLRIR